MKGDNAKMLTMLTGVKTAQYRNNPALFAARAELLLEVRFAQMLSPAFKLTVQYAGLADSNEGCTALKHLSFVASKAELLWAVSSALELDAACKLATL